MKILADVKTYTCLLLFCVVTNGRTFKRLEDSFVDCDFETGTLCPGWVLDPTTQSWEISKDFKNVGIPKPNEGEFFIFLKPTGNSSYATGRLLKTEILLTESQSIIVNYYISNGPGKLANLKIMAVLRPPKGDPTISIILDIFVFNDGNVQWQTAEGKITIDEPGTKIDLFLEGTVQSADQIIAISAISAISAN